MRLKPLYRLRNVTWDVTGDFLTDGLNHGGIKSRVTAAVGLYTQCIKAALYELDGPNGRLNRVVVERGLSQPFTAIPSTRFIELWGGDYATAMTTHAVTYVPKNATSPGSFSGIVPSRDFRFANDNTVVVEEDAFERIRENIRVSDGHTPTFQISYRTGLARDLASLPDDLKFAVYAMARFKYDYRDTLTPRNTTQINWVKSILNKYKLRHRDLE